MVAVHLRSTVHPKRPQFGMDPWRPIGIPTALVERVDLLAKVVSSLSCGGHPFAPGPGAAGGDAQDTAEADDGMVGPLLLDKLVGAHRVESVSRAKKAAAFLRSRVFRARCGSQGADGAIPPAPRLPGHRCNDLRPDRLVCARDAGSPPLPPGHGRSRLGGALVREPYCFGAKLRWIGRFRFRHGEHLLGAFTPSLQVSTKLGQLQIP